MGGKTKGNRLWDFTVLAVVLLFLALGLLFIANLSGCGLIPQDRQAALKQEAIQGLGSKTTTDVVTTAKPEPLAPIKMKMTGKDGATVEVEQPVPVVTQTTAKTRVNESADSKTTGMLSESVHIPLSVALLVGAVACSIFAGLFFLLIKRSVAARTLAAGLDRFASTAITRIQAEAAKTTDPDASRTLIGLSSELQKSRFDNTP